MKIFLLIDAGAVFLLSVPAIYSAFNLKHEQTGVHENGRNGGAGKRLHMTARIKKREISRAFKGWGPGSQGEM